MRLYGTVLRMLSAAWISPDYADAQEFYEGPGACAQQASEAFCAVLADARGALTGRNHHSAHMGGISEIAYGFPGYDGVIPRSRATVAECCGSTASARRCFGKDAFHAGVGDESGRAV